MKYLDDKYNVLIYNIFRGGKLASLGILYSSDIEPSDDALALLGGFSFCFG